MADRLEVRTLRELWVADAAEARPRPLSAASGLVRAGSSLFVVADDENHLGCFSLEQDVPGRLVRLFEGELPPEHRARKKAKPDSEALLRLPAFAACPHGALLALGSGSRPSRRRGAWIALDGSGALHGPVQPVDLAPLYAPLDERIDDLNIEGGFVAADRFCLLQRGNGRAGIDALIEWNWRQVLDRLLLQPAAGGLEPEAFTRHDLGSIDGVRLSFTDAAALPDGRWLFSAAAEDSSGTYTDGLCMGSAIGVVATDGSIESIQRLAVDAKIEGIAASLAGERIELLMVTDGDDRSRPATLLTAALRLRARAA